MGRQALVKSTSRATPARVLSSILVVGVSADVNLKVLSEGYGVYTVRKVARFCIDRKCTLDAVPPESEGLQAIQTKTSDKLLEGERK